MTDQQNVYSPRYILSWSVASITVGLLLLGMFFFGDSLLHLGHIVWALLRWLSRPII